MKIIGKFFKKLGPGIITGSADDDPSGIATYSQAGAQFSLKLLWTALFTLPLMVVVQEMCARIGMVTGQGLAQTFKSIFSRRVLLGAVVLLFLANIFNIGADFGIMASSIKLLLPSASLYFLIIAVAVISLLLEIFISYKTYFHILKWLCLALFAYWLTALLVVTDWGEIFKNTILPHLEWHGDYLMILVAFLGTTISPYLFFWQTSEEVEEEIGQGRTTIKERRGATKEEISNMRRDTWMGMIFSNFTTFFIVVTTAETLFKNGLYNITSAAEAAMALRPLAGDLTYFLFTLGIIGVGLLAIPVLAGSAAYALAEIFNLREGLFFKWRQAKGFYTIIGLAILTGVLMNFIGLNPIRALIYAAVLNGLTAPVFIFMILKAANSQKIMGQFTNSRLVNIFGWLTFIFMAGAGLAFLGSLVF
ncbi:MAG: divalent metal cation transporter [Candidatus Komeilibacteria bacterium]|nr:divalent metal cation transporter [Candidatus Komeilibacteria bacterium]